jgi:hypothetical protein
VGVRENKPPICDTSYRLSLIRGPVVTIGSVGVEGAGREERKEVILEHGSATFCCKRANIIRGDVTRAALQSHVITP